MSTQFSDREKSFEARFKMDQDNTLKAETCQNRLLGLWLAENSDYRRQIMKHISDHGAKVPEADAHQKLTELRATTCEQETAE